MPDLNNIDFIDIYQYDLSRPSRGLGLDFIDIGGDTAPIDPVVSNVTPTPNTVITSLTPLSFDVTDDLNSFKRIIIVAEFPLSKIKEVVFDGAGFGPMYTNASNTQTGVLNGFHFTILRDGGWLPGDGPVLTPFALDTSGGENV